MQKCDMDKKSDSVLSFVGTGAGKRRILLFSREIITNKLSENVSVYTMHFKGRTSDQFSIFQETRLCRLKWRRATQQQVSKKH